MELLVPESEITTCDFGQKGYWRVSFSNKSWYNFSTGKRLYEKGGYPTITYLEEHDIDEDLELEDLPKEWVELVTLCVEKYCQVHDVMAELSLKKLFMRDVKEMIGENGYDDEGSGDE